MIQTGETQDTAADKSHGTVLIVFDQAGFIEYPSRFWGFAGGSHHKSGIPIGTINE